MSDMNSISEGVRKVVESWRPLRGERLQRTALDPADFDQLADAGFTRTVVPVAMNGAWESVEVLYQLKLPSSTICSSITHCLECTGEYGTARSCTP